MTAHVVEGALSKDECDFFTNKLIAKFDKGDLSSFHDEPQVLIIEEQDSDDLKFVRKCYEKLINAIGDKDLTYLDGSLSLWQPGTEGTIHVDNADSRMKSYKAKYSAIFYLNDDYEGGEIYFPNLNINYKPVKGSFVWFPNDELGDYIMGHSYAHFEHAHMVKKVKTNHRCTLPIWVGYASPTKQIVK